MPEHPTFDLAKDRALGSVGNQQVFLAEWIRLGEKEASEGMCRALFYLLYGEGEEADRLSDLLGSDHELSMTGLKEMILTKALCMAFTNRWIPSSTIRESPARRRLSRPFWGSRCLLATKR